MPPIISLENSPTTKECFYVRSMKLNNNQGVFSGILDDSEESIGFGYLSLNDKKKLYYGQVKKTINRIIFHGFGKLINTLENFIYTGEFMDGEMTGYGVKNMIEITNCEIDQEHLMKGEKNEETFLINSTETRFIGKWKKGKFIEGRIVKDGKIYDGQFYDLKSISGEGMIKEIDKSFFYGRFKNGELDETGLSLKGNDLYYGTWKEGKLDGQSGLKLTSTDLYFGGWELGEKDGEGMYMNRLSWEITRGSWKSGFLEGKINCLSKDKLRCEIYEDTKLKKKEYSFSLNDQTIIPKKEEKKE